MFQAIQKSELVMFIIAMGVLLFVVNNFSRLKMFPTLNILLAGFAAFWMAWLFTILEGFLLHGFLNFMEHICYIAGSILIAAWCWKVFGKKGI
jgi:hypothetical protein